MSSDASTASHHLLSEIDRLMLEVNLHEDIVVTLGWLLVLKAVAEERTDATEHFGNVSSPKVKIIRGD